MSSTSGRSDLRIWTSLAKLVIRSFSLVRAESCSLFSSRVRADLLALSLAAYGGPNSQSASVQFKISYNDFLAAEMKYIILIGERPFA